MNDFEFMVVTIGCIIVFSLAPLIFCCWQILTELTRIGGVVNVIMSRLGK